MGVLGVSPVAVLPALQQRLVLPAVQQLQQAYRCRVNMEERGIHDQLSVLLGFARTRILGTPTVFEFVGPKRARRGVG
jgi:hypothetical protein